MREKGESAFDDVVGEDKSESDLSSKGAGEESGDTGKTETEKREAQDSKSNSQAANHPNSISDTAPAFPYSEVTQRPVYPRDQAWKSVEDLKYYADGKLREEFDVRNGETREFDEALAVLITEKITARELAEKVIELRGFTPEE